MGHPCKNAAVLQSSGVLNGGWQPSNGKDGSELRTDEQRRVKTRYGQGGVYCAAGADNAWTHYTTYVVPPESWIRLTPNSMVVLVCVQIISWISPFVMVWAAWQACGISRLHGAPVLLCVCQRLVDRWRLKAPNTSLWTHLLCVQTAWSMELSGMQDNRIGYLPTYARKVAVVFANFEMFVPWKLLTTRSNDCHMGFCLICCGVPSWKCVSMSTLWGDLSAVRSSCVWKSYG